MPAFTPQPQGVTALWLVLIARTHERMARLSWPGCLVTYEIHVNVRHREFYPDTVTYLSTNRARRRLTSLIETNALPLRQTRPPTVYMIMMMIIITNKKEKKEIPTEISNVIEWVVCGDKATDDLKLQ